MQPNPTPTPLVCVPGAIPAADRPGHFALVQRLIASVQERQEIPNGYAFRFGPEALAEVARFIDNERKCCPFLTFQLTVSPSDGPVWLRMDGPDGTRDFLDAEMLS